MILQALYKYYETLVGKGELSRPGWDRNFKVSFALELDDGGRLINVLDLREEGTIGKKTALMPRVMEVPAHKVRTVGIASNFLCDNSTYILGADGKDREKDRKRALDCFSDCAGLHRQILSTVDSPAAKAVLGFFEHWTPETAPEHPLLAPRWKDISGNANLVFFYNMRAVTEDPDIKAAWQRYYDAVDPDAFISQCLVTGEEQPIAATHPMIKGVMGAQSSGAALVSFNAPAFCSYGHEQNFNAPVGKCAAFGYTAALNYLLADREHCRVIGDTTVVCWAEHGERAYQDFGLNALYGSDNSISDEDLAALLNKLARGEAINWNNTELDPGEHFFFLGISPNAARLSVRFFLRDSFGNFVRNIERHYEDINIVRPAFDTTENLPLWRLASETVNQNSRNKSASPQLAGDLLRAVLMGTPYPATLINGVQLRIRAEHEITRGRAAIIKGYYRRANVPCEKEVFTVQLNEESNYTPYVLGQLFSVLEALQEAANPGINATIKDKYFNSASAAPANVFPVLISLGQKHMRKLDIGQKTYYDKQITRLLGMMTEEFPTRLTLPQQGAFQIGYYHQTQKRYTKKEDK